MGVLINTALSAKMERRKDEKLGSFMRTDGPVVFTVISDMEVKIGDKRVVIFKSGIKYEGTQHSSRKISAYSPKTNEEYVLKINQVMIEKSGYLR